MSAPRADLTAYALLEDRAVLSLGGEDRKTFLQGLVSNDVRRVSAEQAIYAALLTPQGKYLHDFLIVEENDSLLIDCERARIADLRRRLSLYKLRSQVEISEKPGLVVAVIPGVEAATLFGLPLEAGRAAAFAGGVAFVDPRLPALGVRVIMRAEGAANCLAAAGVTMADASIYDRLRVEWGIPDGSRDMIIEKSLPLECGFDDLNGIDWNKGCYMGQELTARMHYRALVKKRLLPVMVDGPLPAPGTPILSDDREAGEMRSGRDGAALAMLRLEHLPASGAASTLTAGSALITPRIPSWVKLPAAATE